jgi:glycosyltransferase involved in cell wall biosynthesis
MSTIRVGLSTTTIEPVLTQGRLDGIGVYTNALMRGLPQSNCSVTGLSFPRTLGDTGTQKFSVGQAMPRSYAVWSLRDAVWPGPAAREMPLDLYHATDYRIVKMPCPVVATLHDAIPLKYPEWTSPRLRSLKNWVQKKAAGKADHVIALSHFAITELVECFGIDEKRITVVPCGVGAEWKQAPDEAAVDETLRSHGLERGYFLFVGTLQPRKNVERIVDAYLALPADVRKARQLVIVGRAGWRCEDLLKKMEAAIQNGERVVWLNNLSGEERLRHMYAGASVFVFPSLYEGFGIPVAEAFACGVPVVTSNTTSLPEVSEGAALEVDPLSVPQIASAMLELARDDKLRERCIAAGHERAAQLTWQRTVDETVAVYRQVLGRQK